MKKVDEIANPPAPPNETPHQRTLREVQTQVNSHKMGIVTFDQVEKGACALYAWTRQESFSEAMLTYSKMSPFSQDYFRKGARLVLEGAVSK